MACSNRVLTSLQKLCQTGRDIQHGGLGDVFIKHAVVKLEIASNFATKAITGASKGSTKLQVKSGQTYKSETQLLLILIQSATDETAKILEKCGAEKLLSNLTSASTNTTTSHIYWRKLVRIGLENKSYHKSK